MHCASLNEWHKNVPRSTRTPSVIGFAVLVICGVGFGAWAGLAPLQGAVVASGSFVATGQNKQIQHLEGGILREVYVKEGEVVEAGQTLARLDDTAAKAKLRRLQTRQYRLIASRARLEAELSEKDDMETPAAYLAVAKDPEMSSILERQRSELKSRRVKLNAEQDVFRKEIAGLNESILGYQAQVKSAQSRLALFKEELQYKSALLEKQLARKADVLSLQRSEAGIGGELGEQNGRIADAKEKIARANQQIASLRSTALQKAIEELRTTETELDDLEEQARAAQDVVNRVEIKAPVRGAIVKLNYHTQGGVVPPGGVILEMLPVNEELLIEVRVKPADVVNVREGQEALVRLSSLNQRITPMIAARVSYLSADIVADQSGQNAQQASSSRGSSFIVRVKMDPDDVKRKAENFQPAPGLPADVFIKTAERTFFDYIMQPVFDSFARAFREH